VGGLQIPVPEITSVATPTSAHWREGMVRKGSDQAGHIPDDLADSFNSSTVLLWCAMCSAPVVPSSWFECVGNGCLHSSWCSSLLHSGRLQ
jgi:hypothetical protein